MRNKVILDENAFRWIKHSAKLISNIESQQEKNPMYASEYPEEIGIQLTYRCNLKCRHCFQLNDTGYFQYNGKPKDLSLDVLKRIIDQTSIINPRLYLWGGEPLLYREWNSLIEILHKNPRECVICTNGLLINKRIDSIIGLPISPNFLISLDGFKYEHEFLRGKGTFNSVVENIRLIIEKKRKNLFHGSISINCVINDKNVGKLFEFASFCEELGVDALFYCFPWHISSETAKKMDLCCSTHFPFIDLAKKGKNSWYSFGYHLDLEYYEDLMRQIDKLESKSWKIHLRFNPKMEEFEIKDYLQGNDKPARNRNRCLAISNRMDVLADGSVSTCKHFPELNVGNLNHHTVLELWRSNKYNHIREVVNENLMPVCANCVLLYQNGR